MSRDSRGGLQSRSAQAQAGPNLAAMSLRAGPYTFTHVTYDAPSDVLYAAITRPTPGTRTKTPEEHVLRFDERGRFSGMTLVNLRDQIAEEGGVYVSLPTGDRVRVQGAEAAMRAT